MDDLRVLHVIEAMHQGGAETVVLEHARHRGSTVDVAVCAINRGGPVLEAVREVGCLTRVLDEGDGNRAWRRLTRVGRIAQLIRDERIAIVNAHNPTGSLYGVLAARLAGVPAVRTEHSIHEPGRHSMLYGVAEPRLTALSSRVICVSDQVRSSHSSRLGSWAERFVTIRNGVSEAVPSADRAEARRRFGLSEGEVAIVHVGSLTTQKAQHVLLDAFAALSGEHPEARLLIAGDGPLANMLKLQHERLGLGERARFLGAIDGTADLLTAGDVFALSSVREGLPISILEAMSARLPVVATTIGGVPEVVVDNETGLVVPPEDRSALAAALARLLGSPELRAEMGRAGRDRWARAFSAERMVYETESLYRDVLNRPSGNGPQ